MWKAPTVTLSLRQQAILQCIVKSRTSRSDHRQRAHLILLFGEGCSNSRVAQQVDLKRRQVGCWRERWLENQEKLLAVEASTDAKSRDLENSILEMLSDLPRSGTKPTFSAEQIAQILTVACQDPQKSGLPFCHWTLSELRREVMERNIVKSISTSRLQVFLKSGGVKTA